VNGFLAHERGQGAVEYVLILAMLAIVCIMSLLLFGLSLGDVYASVTGTVEATNANQGHNDSDLIVSVSATRTGHGSGDDVRVLVEVSERTRVTASDSQSGRSVSFTCRHTCRKKFREVGDGAGTITTTADRDVDAAHYEPRR
jgi:Flp pilus assembly pilin Flp